jgi:hypothetical protein
MIQIVHNWKRCLLGNWEIDGSPKMTTTEPNWEIAELGNWEIEGSLKMKLRSLRCFILIKNFHRIVNFPISQSFAAGEETKFQNLSAIGYRSISSY